MTNAELIKAGDRYGRLTVVFIVKGGQIMEKELLIEALRYCAEHEGCDYYIAKDCPRADTWVCGADCEQILMRDAADALEADEKRIADLEAQLQKEGEWLRTDAFPHRIYCSVCYKTYVPNDRWQIWVDDELPKNYCPNCGAKMDGGKADA